MLVQTQALSKQYGSFTALDNCSLRAQRGEIFGLLGPNGSGKTTLIRLLMGYLRPSAGAAQIEGLDCYRQSVQVHRRVSYLPGDPRLFRQMRGLAVLKFFSAARPNGDLGRAVKIAERLELDLSQRVSRCSTGMRQKLALAAVLSADAPIFILDEPTANLDPTVRSEVLEILSESREQGRTVMLSSHVLSEIEQSCDRVAILRQGQLVHTQQMSELAQRHRIVGQLSSSMPDVPLQLRDQLTVTRAEEGRVVIDTSGELSQVLGYLAQLPLHELRIQPIGMQVVYDRYHSSNAVRGEATG